MGKPLLKENEVPNGGIADFIMTSDEIKRIEALEAREQFGNSGIANFEEVASRMSSYGRFGDDTVAHLQKGEIIVPKALIEQNPVLKESIFNHLKELGIEDPERYVVGSSANSINPDTGMPEFFLKGLFKGLKKGVSGIAKGIGKIFKGVGKVLKKVAPVILPFVLTAVGIPPILAQSLGAGIGTLAAGGDAKSALKSALFGAFTGAVTAGIRGPDTFFKNVGKGFTVGKPAAFLQNKFSSTFGPEGTYTTLGKSGLKTGQLANVPYGVDKSLDNLLTDGKLDPSKIISSGKDVGFFSQNPEQQRSTFMDYLTRGGKSKAELADLATKAGDDYLAEMAKLKITPTEAGLKAAKASVQPGFLATYGPSAALATGATAALGGFETKKDEEIPYMTTEEQYAANEPLYAINSQNFQPQYINPNMYAANDPYYSAGLSGLNPYLSPQFQQVQTVKDGGEIFPRRTGGIAPDEGVAGKDSVRAMLMPGEFVMTTNAVKGMGNGNLDQGINNMYGMMRNLENRERMMA